MDIFSMSKSDLDELAKKYEIDASKTANRQELEDLIQVAINKRMLALEERAKAERMKEAQEKLRLDPASKARPAPETINIANSEKVYAVFMNLEQEGVDVTFNQGCTHTFHLWHDFIHILPKNIIDAFRDPNNPLGKRPIYQRRPHPSIPDVTMDMVVGHRKRFNFEVLDKKPPQDKAYGVVLDRNIYKKLAVPFPQPVAHAG